MTASPFDQKADQPIVIALTAERAIVAGAACKVVKAMADQTGGGNKIGPALFDEVGSQVYKAVAEGLVAVGLSADEIDELLHEVNDRVAIFGQENR